MATEEKKEKATGLQAFNRTIRAEETQQYLADVLKERKGSFINNLTALVSNDKALQECEPYTIMFAALKATALDLPLDKSLGFAFVIPYNDNKNNRKVAQFQLGYKGIKQLALRSGQFAIIPNATDVRQGELVRRNRLTGDCEFAFEEDDQKREKLPIIGFASYFRLLNGAESTFYMSIEEVQAHALRYSQTYRSKNEKVKAESKWTTDFVEMAKKTVIKLNLSRNAPLSVETRDALNADQSVMFHADKYEYIDNETSEEKERKQKELAEKFADYEEVK